MLAILRRLLIGEVLSELVSSQGDLKDMEIYQPCPYLFKIGIYGEMDENDGYLVQRGY